MIFLITFRINLLNGLSFKPHFWMRLSNMMDSVIFWATQNVHTAGKYQSTRGIIRCKDCVSGRMLQCPDCIVASHQFMNPLHCVEMSFVTCFTSHLMWINHLSRDGMACFSTKIPSRTLDFVISLVTLAAAARFLYLGPKISLSLIPLGRISSLLTTATARIYHWQLVHNCYMKNGFQQHSLVLKRFSLSTVSKTFMNSPYKARWISTTTTILYCDDLTVPVLQGLLYVFYTFMSSAADSYFNRTATPKFTVFSECGGILWLSNGLVAAMTQEESTKLLMGV